MDGLVLRAEDIGALTPELLDRVAQGEAVDITREGAVIAKLVAARPIAPGSETRPIRKLIEAMQANREKMRQMGISLTQAEIRALRDDHTA